MGWVITDFLTSQGEAGYWVVPFTMDCPRDTRTYRKNDIRKNVGMRVAFL